MVIEFQTRIEGMPTLTTTVRATRENDGKWLIQLLDRNHCVVKELTLSGDALVKLAAVEVLFR